MEKTEQTPARPGYGLWKRLFFVSSAINTSSYLLSRETAQSHALEVTIEQNLRLKSASPVVRGSMEGPEEI